MRSIAIDLGENSVKIVDLIEHKKTVILQSVAEKKLSANVNEHDREIEAIEFVRKYLLQMDFAKNQIPPRYMMAIRQDRVTVRTKIFPFTDRQKISKSLPFEMEDDIPFDPENCVFDFKIINTENTTAQVLAVAVQKTQIEKCLSLAKDFGIELHGISVEGLAFANLIEQWQETPPSFKLSPSEFELSSGKPEQEMKKDAELVIHFGHRHTLITAYMERRLVFARTAVWGTDTVLQELVRKYQYPYTEAQKVLQNQAKLLLGRQGEDFDTQNLVSTIEKSLRELVRELQITFLELQSTYKANIKAIHLSGGFSELENIGAYLTQSLDVVCNPTDLTAPFFTSQTINNSERISGFSPGVMAPAIAIAIEGLKKSKNAALQFIRDEFIAENNQLKNFWIDWGKLISISSAMILILFVWSSFRVSYSTELVDESLVTLKKKAKEIARLPKKEANERGVKKFISENKKRALEIKQISEFAKMNSALDILKKVTDSAPDRSQVNLDIKTLNVIDNLVEIDGYANSPREITILTNKLSSLAKDQKVNQQDSILQAQPNRVTFKLSFLVDRGLQLNTNSNRSKTE